MTEHDDLLRKFSQQIDSKQPEDGKPEAEVASPDPGKTTAAPGTTETPERPQLSRIESAIADSESKVSASARAQSSRLLKIVLFSLVLLAALGGFFYLQNLPETAEQKPVVFSLPEKHSIPVRPATTEPLETSEEVAPNPAQVTEAEPVAEVAEKSTVKEQPVAAATEEKVPAAKGYQLKVGPFVSKSTLEAATAQLQQMGYQPQVREGRGMVPMIRLQEGIYPAEEARRRLAVLKKKVKSAFILPRGEQRALYAASFHDLERADRLRNKLASQGVKLTPVTSELEMEGKLLILDTADQTTARQAAVAIENAGLRVQLMTQN